MEQNSTFKIISAYKGMINYVNAAISASDDNLDELWLRHVIDPFWDQWASGQFNEARVREEMQRPITNMEKLSCAVGLLDSSNVEVIIEKTYKQIEALLPSPEPGRVICIYANPYLGEEVHGVVGSCVGDNILIQINPAIKNWKDIIPWILAHEYHHSIWGYNYYFIKGNRDKNLLTSLIVDGQADSFGKYICPHITPFWISALTREQELDQWKIIKNYLHSSDVNTYVRFFFGDKKQNTPPYTAYTIGYHIVQAYLRKYPEISFAELLDINGDEILSLSEYNGESK